jgi:hypothetical protein
MKPVEKCKSSLGVVNFKIDAIKDTKKNTTISSIQGLGVAYILQWRICPVGSGR